MAGLAQGLGQHPRLGGDGGVHPAPLGQRGLSRSTDGQARWRVTDKATGALTGQQQIKVKMVKPPAKVQIPRGEAQEEMQEEEEPRAGGGEMGEGRTLPFCSAHGLTCVLSFRSVPAPSPPAPPVVKKPLTLGGAKAAREAEAEPAQEAGAGDGPRPAPAWGEDKVHNKPSREIGNIIRMYQSRPGPVPEPVQPSRWARARPALPAPQEVTLWASDRFCFSGAPPRLS